MFDYEKEQFEKNVEILMEDRCTRKEAERLLKNSTVVYELKDFTEHFGQFMEDWQEDKEGIEAYKKMLETKKPMSGYSFVEYNGKEYLINYCLQNNGKFNIKQSNLGRCRNVSSFFNGKKRGKNE